VLQGMVLRHGENVEAEDRLEEGRVAEGHDAFLLLRKLEANCHRSTFGPAGRRVKQRRSDLLLSESVD
jgi:hypothetical protein